MYIPTPQAVETRHRSGSPGKVKCHHVGWATWNSLLVPAPWRKHRRPAPGAFFCFGFMVAKTIDGRGLHVAMLHFFRESTVPILRDAFTRTETIESSFLQTSDVREYNAPSLHTSKIVLHRGGNPGSASCFLPRFATARPITSARL